MNCVIDRCWKPIGPLLNTNPLFIGATEIEISQIVTIAEHAVGNFRQATRKVDACYIFAISECAAIKANYTIRNIDTR